MSPPAEPSGRGGIPGFPFLVIKTDLFSGSQLIRAAWALERSSVPLDTGQVGGSHAWPSSQEEPGMERGRAWGLQLLGTAALGTDGLLLQAVGPCFLSALEQGPGGTSH